MVLSHRRIGVNEPPSDLVARCVRGDRRALEAVLRAQSPALERLLMRLTGRRSEVEDLLQNTFIAAIRAFPGFRGEASVRSWLTRLAITTFQDHLRQPERRRRAQLVLISDQDALPDATQVDREADARRRLARLATHLDAIAPKKRVAFVLHVVEGYSLEEVATLMNASRTATKSRVFWARRELLGRVSRDAVLRDLLTKDEPW
ncbi:MAG TPA: RNA polymerase sigma factor [Polyangiaceae bacterium]|nr:RNA polymerase sigma factor [Polyangiaceae bacterium]